MAQRYVEMWALTSLHAGYQVPTVFKTVLGLHEIQNQLLQAGNSRWRKNTLGKISKKKR